MVLRSVVLSMVAIVLCYFIVDLCYGYGHGIDKKVGGGTALRFRFSIFERKRCVAVAVTHVRCTVSSLLRPGRHHE